MVHMSVLTSLPFAAGSTVKSPEGVFKYIHWVRLQNHQLSLPRHWTASNPSLSNVERVLAHGDTKVSEFIFNWMVHILQKPQEKMGIAMLFKSVQGTGKNVFWNWFATEIIGIYGVVCEDMDKLIGRFNATIDSKLLTIGDEIGNFGGAYKSNDRLKSLYHAGQLCSSVRSRPDHGA